MAFDYYDRLSRSQKATYRRSDAVVTLALPELAAFAPLLAPMRDGLGRDDRPAVARAVAAFAAEVERQLALSPVKTQVLARRPSSDSSELHGLYTREEGEVPLLQVWMRTAAHQQPVAFRTFLRTVVHEMLHHLDFEHLGLEDTFHTEGFFKRESSVVRQLLGERARRAPGGEAAPDQLDLFSGPPRR